MITLYDTKTREKQLFVPLNPEKIGLYLCGPTVYDLAHIGNARNAIVFDVLVRLLRKLYPNSEIKYVRNITDIDDKINNKAIELGVDISEITSKTIVQYHEDMASLFVLPPDVEPRATEHIDEMIMITERLIHNHHAYVSQGHVLFDVHSNHNRDVLTKTITTEPDNDLTPEYKKHIEDFVLFKPSSSEFPGWNSPWGRIRPGWHLECTAMTWKHLGSDFDIHGGGVDLIFPHHENEISQSCCAFPGTNYANYWVHNQMILVDGKKMSKSLGNFKTIRDVLKMVPGEALRYFILKTHYRSTLDFTVDSLYESKRELDKFYRVLENHVPNSLSYIEPALLDDLNIPLMISVMHQYVKENKLDELYNAGKLIGIFNHTSEEWFRGDIETRILGLIEERNQARINKDFAKSDEIRNQLKNEGIILEDLSTGTTWRKS
jgi:cysteinyl-tRNA synthetase